MGDKFFLKFDANLCVDNRRTNLDFDWANHGLMPYCS